MSDDQRSQVEGAKAVLLVPAPSDVPFRRYGLWVFWASVLSLLGVAPFIPITPLGFLRYAPLVLDFGLGLESAGSLGEHMS